MLSTTTFLLSNTFLLSKFSPPSAAHAFNYIPFIKIFPPSAAHAFNDTRYQGSSATLPDFLLSKFFSPLQPMLSTTFLVSKTFLLSKFSPPSAAHAFNYIPFIKIFPPSAAHAFNDTRYQGSSATLSYWISNQKNPPSKKTLGFSIEPLKINMQNSMRIFDLSKLIVLKTTVHGPIPSKQDKGHAKQISL